MKMQIIKATAKKDKQSINYYSITNLHIQNKFTIVYDSSEPFDGDYTKIDYLCFEDCTFDKFPRAQILLDFIPDLSVLCLWSCELTMISREDLRGLEKLKGLLLDGNMIERLPKRLFECTPNLKQVSFSYNDIKEIDADILDPLLNLRYFDLRGNVEIDVCFDIENGDKGFTLEKFEEEIKKCNPIEKLKAELKNEIEAVKQENVQVKKELAELKAEIEELKLQLVASDFTVIVNGKEFRVNKRLLKANSPMLARLIDEAENLEVTDISTDIFEEILNYMRTKIQPDENANLLELYAASAKLEMKELMDITAEILMQKVNAQNALEVMNFCQKFAHDKLRKKAYEEYKKNFE